MKKPPIPLTEPPKYTEGGNLSLQWLRWKGQQGGKKSYLQGLKRVNDSRKQQAEQQPS